MIARWVTREKKKNGNYQNMDNHQSNMVDSARKKIRTFNYENIDEALFDWFTNGR